MRVEWRQKALEDRERIYDQIEQDSPKAAIELDIEFRDKCLGLMEFPYLYGEGRRKGTREMEVRSNYIVVYCVDEAAQIIEIVRIQPARKKKQQRF